MEFFMMMVGGCIIAALYYCLGEWIGRGKGSKATAEEWAGKYDELGEHFRLKLGEVQQHFNDKMTAWLQLNESYIRHLEQHIRDLEAALGKERL